MTGWSAEAAPAAGRGAADAIVCGMPLLATPTPTLAMFGWGKLLPDGGGRLPDGGGRLPVGSPFGGGPKFDGIPFPDKALVGKAGIVAWRSEI